MHPEYVRAPVPVNDYCLLETKLVSYFQNLRDACVHCILNLGTAADFYLHTILFFSGKRLEYFIPTTFHENASLGESYAMRRSPVHGWHRSKMKSCGLGSLAWLPHDLPIHQIIPQQDFGGDRTGSDSASGKSGPRAAYFMRSQVRLQAVRVPGAAF